MNNKPNYMIEQLRYKQKYLINYHFQRKTKKIYNVNTYNHSHKNANHTIKTQTITTNSGKHSQQTNYQINVSNKHNNTYNKQMENLTKFKQHIELIKKIIQNLFNKHQSLAGDNYKKKIRRPAEQIQKKIQCPYPKCYKSYGSEVSLNLHIKLKHKGGNKTDREKAAQLIWQARQKGKPIPQFYINLPPGFIQEYGYMTKRLRKQQDSQNNQSE